jgi:hypothetical protein
MIFKSIIQAEEGNNDVGGFQCTFSCDSGEIQAFITSGSTMILTVLETAASHIVFESQLATSSLYTGITLSCGTMADKQHAHLNDK